MIKPLLNVFLRLGARWSAWTLLWEMVVDAAFGERGIRGLFNLMMYIGTQCPSAMNNRKLGILCIRKWSRKVYGLICESLFSFEEDIVVLCLLRSTH